MSQESEILSNDLQELFVKTLKKEKFQYDLKATLNTINELWKKKTESGLEFSCFWAGAPFPSIINMPLFLSLKEFTNKKIDIYMLYHDAIANYLNDTMIKEFNPKSDFDAILRKLGISPKKKDLAKDVRDKIITDPKFKGKYGPKRELLLKANEETAAFKILPTYPQFQIEYFMAANEYGQQGVDFIIAGEDRFLLYEICKAIDGKTIPVLYMKRAFDFKDENNKNVKPLTLFNNKKLIDDFILSVSDTQTKIKFLAEWKLLYGLFTKYFGENLTLDDELADDLIKAKEQIKNIVADFSQFSTNKADLSPHAFELQEPIDLARLTDSLDSINLAILGILIENGGSLTSTLLDAFFVPKTNATLKKKLKDFNRNDLPNDLQNVLSKIPDVINPDLELSGNTIDNHIDKLIKIGLVDRRQINAENSILKDKWEFSVNYSSFTIDVPTHVLQNFYKYFKKIID